MNDYCTTNTGDYKGVEGVPLSSPKDVKDMPRKMPRPSGGGIEPHTGKHTSNTAPKEYR